MAHYELIWSFDTANYRVEYCAAPDEDLDLSWDDDGSTPAKAWKAACTAPSWREFRYCTATPKRC